MCSLTQEYFLYVCNILWGCISRWCHNRDYQADELACMFIAVFLQDRQDARNHPMLHGYDDDSDDC